LNIIYSDSIKIAIKISMNIALVFE